MSGKKRQTKKKYNYPKEDKKSTEKLSKKKKRKNKKYTKKIGTTTYKKIIFHLKLT